MDTAHFLLTHNPQEMVPTNLNDSTYDGNTNTCRYVGMTLDNLYK